MKFLILLAGAGLGDGSAIEEVILTYTILDKYEVEYIPTTENKGFIPIDHLRYIDGEVRSLLVESARIARGIIKDMDEIDPRDFDGIIIPGGRGLMANLGESKKTKELIMAFYESKKPIAIMCAAIDYLRKILGPDLFKGQDMDFRVDSSYYDCDYNVYYTPAFRKGSNLYKMELGIDYMIRAIIGK